MTPTAYAPKLEAVARAVQHADLLFRAVRGERQLPWEDLDEVTRARWRAWAERVLFSGSLHTDEAALVAIARASAVHLGMPAVDAGISLDNIKREVARRFGLTVGALEGQARQKHIALARHVAMWVAVRASFSRPATGRALGHRDHSTVVSAVRKVDALRLQDHALAAVLDAICVVIGLKPPETTTAPVAVPEVACAG